MHSAVDDGVSIGHTCFIWCSIALISLFLPVNVCKLPRALLLFSLVFTSCQLYLSRSLWPCSKRYRMHMMTRHTIHWGTIVERRRVCIDECRTCQCIFSFEIGEKRKEVGWVADDDDDYERIFALVNSQDQSTIICRENRSNCILASAISIHMVSASTDRRDEILSRSLSLFRHKQHVRGVVVSRRRLDVYKQISSENKQTRGDNRSMWMSVRRSNDCREGRRFISVAWYRVRHEAEIEELMVKKNSIRLSVPWSNNVLSEIYWLRWDQSEEASRSKE